MFQRHVFEIGQRLRAGRKSKNLTLSQVATAQGLSAALISNCERGLLPKRLQTLADLARYLDVDISDGLRALGVAQAAAAGFTSVIDADANETKRSA